MNLNVLIMLLVILLSTAAQAEELHVWLLAVNGAQRSAFALEVSRFEKIYPGVNVQLNILENEAYKKMLFTTLRQKQAPDVLFMFGGRDIEDAVQQNLIHSLEPQWQSAWKNQLSPAASSAVMVNGQHYGLPLDYYAWGIYYNIAVFHHYGIEPPHTWKDLLNTCMVLRQNQMTPFALGSKELWPVAAWFDNLDLRLNGLQFHLELLRGRQSWNDPRVSRVFAYWQQLMSSGCFMLGHEKFGWRDVLPFLYHRQAAMMLMGNFWTAQIPSPLRTDFALIPFPVIDPHVPDFEDSPTDVLVISSRTRHLELAQKFLDFFALIPVQDDIAHSVGMLAVHRGFHLEQDPFIVESRLIIDHAQGVAQYFDRDAGALFSDKAMNILEQFMLNKEDAIHAQNELDHLSQKLNGY